MQQKGLSELLFDSLESVNKDIRKNISHNILVTGGCSLQKGFKDRIKKELVEIWDDKINLKFGDGILDYCQKARNISVSDWITDNVISKKMYQEYGSYYIVDLIKSQ